MSALFKGKLVLITGAARGVGLAIFEYFMHHGADLIVLDNSKEHLVALEKQLQAAKMHYHALYLDVTNAKEVCIEFQAAEKIMGKPVDILVNVVGGGLCELLQDSTPEIFKRDLDLNLLSAYNCFEALRASFLKKGAGVVINIGSVNGMTTFGHPCYSAAKAGLESYTKAIAVEYGKHGIRANIICPGTVKTRLWEERAARNPGVFEEIKKWYPLNDIVKTQDIAEAVGFLASDAAKMITGVALPVDAGLMAGHPAMVESFTQRKL